MWNCLEYFIDQCWDELEDAEEYTQKAMAYRETHRKWADVLYQTAMQEHSHYEAFCEMAAHAVLLAKNEHDEAANYIEHRWKREKEKLVRKETQLKMLFESYRG